MISDTGYIPFYDKLTEAEKSLVKEQCYTLSAKKGSLIHHSGDECIGIIIVKSGSVRAFTTPEKGKEITLYRLFPYDICIFSASCMFDSSLVPISLEAEEDCVYIVLPTQLYRNLESTSLAAAQYINAIMKERFADIMWLLDQILNKRMNVRLAALIVEEDNSGEVVMTQEKMASHLGTAREVITRTLKYLQDDGLIKIGRGSITILDLPRLTALASESIK